MTACDVLVQHQHQRHAVAACHASEADLTPSIPATRHPVSNVAKPTSQPSNSVGQASRQVQWDDGKALRCSCRPSAHAIPPCSDQWRTTQNARDGSAGVWPTIAIVPFAPAPEAFTIGGVGVTGDGTALGGCST
jgi:hypothetical protein